MVDHHRAKIVNCIKEYLQHLRKDFPTPAVVRLAFCTGRAGGFTVAKTKQPILIVVLHPLLHNFVIHSKIFESFSVIIETAISIISPRCAFSHTRGILMCLLSCRLDGLRNDFQLAQASENI